MTSAEKVSYRSTLKGVELAFRGERILRLRSESVREGTANGTLANPVGATSVATLE